MHAENQLRSAVAPPAERQETAARAVLGMFALPEPALRSGSAAQESGSALDSVVRWALEEIAPGSGTGAGCIPRDRDRGPLATTCAAERVVIDPIAPSVGLDWFEEHGAADLTSLLDEPSPLSLERRLRRALRRHSARRPRAADARVRQRRDGSSRSTSATSSRVASDAHAVGAICPVRDRDCSIPAHDALGARRTERVRWAPSGPLAFVPDVELMDEPE